MSRFFESHPLNWLFGTGHKAKYLIAGANSRSPQILILNVWSSMPSFTEHFQKLPKSIQNYLQYTVDQLKPEQLILFGSRARGDHRENSDFDIAVLGVDASAKWTEVNVSLLEKNFSLYPVDLVQLEKLGPDYQRNIQKEGKVIYG
jgi:predicted nucleotidyltransferase